MQLSLAAKTKRRMVMGKLHVTGTQGDEVVRMANSKGVSREQFQKALDNASFSRFLDSLKTDVMGVEPPEGGRIYGFRVIVDYGRDWQDAVKAASSDSPLDRVLAAGDRYLSVSNEVVEEEILLLNFPNIDDNWDRAQTWAEAQGLKRTNPREIFAISEQYPELNESVGQDIMYVLATAVPLNGGKCNVVWCDDERVPGFGVTFSNFYVWLAFRK